MNYNLMDEGWIPVLYRDGRWGHVGIRRALEDASQIRGIAASNPMDRMAIIRFLLALLYWCKGNPPNEDDATLSAPFPADWFERLDARRDYFDLLGEEKRFYQYHGPSNTKLPANYLIHEVPTGTNICHFHHSSDKRDGLCLACCATGLLRLPLFATSGGSGKTPGVNARPPIYVMPMGDSLAATLRLSWRAVSRLGIPAWEAPETRLPETGNVPVLLGLTWLPRRVWLDDPEEPESSCISCGSRELLVRQTVFAGVGSVKADKDGLTHSWCDPHVIYTSNAKGDIKSLLASDALNAPNTAVGQWATIAGGMLRDEKTTHAVLQASLSAADRAKVHLWIVGFSTVQNDKYLEATERLFPWFDSDAIHDLPRSIDRLKQWHREGSSFARKASTPNKSSREYPEIEVAISAIRPHVEDRVSANVNDLVADADGAWEQVCSEYQPMMEVIAKSLAPGFTTQAVLARDGICRRRPNMQSKAARKPAREKGDGK